MKVLVIGASEKVERYSNQAVRLLVDHGHEVVAIGTKDGEAHGVEIECGTPDHSNIDTVTLYIGARHQKQYYSYISELAPNRVIFNPGAENQEFKDDLSQLGIETENACTIVLLRLGLF